MEIEPEETTCSHQPPSVVESGIGGGLVVLLKVTDESKDAVIIDLLIRPLSQLTSINQSSYYTECQNVKRTHFSR